jgi:hypothetical protein
VTATTGIPWELDLSVGTWTVRPHKSDAKRGVVEWRPKDRDLRKVPLDNRAVRMLKAWRAAVALTCPYVFISPERLAYIRIHVDRGKWPPSRRWILNHIRTLHRMRDQAQVLKVAWHDL